MKFTRIAVLLFVLISSRLAVRSADAELIPSQDGRTVCDTTLKVNWLANANLASTPDLGFASAFSGTFGPNGSMDYATAVLWVKYLKDNNYLGHTDWQLPTTPVIDGSCSVAKPGPSMRDGEGKEGDVEYVKDLSEPPSPFQILQQSPKPSATEWSNASTN